MCQINNPLGLTVQCTWVKVIVSVVLSVFVAESCSKAATTRTDKQNRVQGRGIENVPSIFVTLIRLL